LRKNPLGQTRRIGEKNGTKRMPLVDARGIPLSLVVSGANTHDSKLLDDVLGARIVSPAEGTEQDVCLDAAFVGKEEVVEAHGYTPHIRPRGEEAQEIKRNPDFKARRWIVELFHSWMNRFRKLIPRYEKTDLSYCALLKLACGMIVWNRIEIIYG